MATESTKTLAEIDASVPSERAQSPEKPLDSPVQSQESGDRVSAGGDVHLGGEVAETRVVHTKISVQKSFVCSSTKTLTEVDASLSSERAQWPEPLGYSVQSQENGDRFSSGDRDDDVHLRGDSGEEVETRVFQTEITVQKSFECWNGDDSEFLRHSIATGDSSSLEHETEDMTEHGGQSEEIEGLADGDSTRPNGDGPNKTMELNQNGNSLVTEVEGSLDNASVNGQNCGYEDDKGFAAENAGNTGDEFMKIPDSRGTRKHEVNKNGQEIDDDDVEVEVSLDGVNVSGQNHGYEDDKSFAAENGENTGEEFKKDSYSRGTRKHEVNKNGQEIDDDDDGEEDEDREDVGNEEHEYLVGDFVWGKIRSHPWWPGQIYDPSDASEFARKYNQGEWLLVAYFGDGSFSWCSPSQLRPFAESFEEMSKQSQSISFVNAVQKALDEIGRLVELKMTCSCIEEDQTRLVARPPSINAGIKQGVLVPAPNLNRFLIPLNEPAKLLFTLKYLAEVVSITSMVELTVLRSWLLAFYQANGGHKLATCHEPFCIEGLEDKNRTGVITHASDFSVPVEVPFEGPSEEDWLSSSPVLPGLGKTKNSLLQRCLDDKLYQRKKKSVAELMKEDMVVVESNNKKGRVLKDVTTTTIPVSTSGKRKRKSDDEALYQADSDLISPSGRKIERENKKGILGSAENKASSAKNGDGEGEKLTKKEILMEKGKTDRFEGEKLTKKKEKLMGKGKTGSKVKGKTDSKAKGKTEAASASRERKKSKYLSPPYINLKWRGRDGSSEREVEAKSVKIAKVEQIGERMSRAVSKLIGSPSGVVNCSDKTLQDKNYDTPRDHKKIIETPEINASTEEVVSQVRSTALNPLRLKKKKAVDMFKGFISAFRNAIYLNGSNYKMYNMGRHGRKRKSLSSSGPGLLGEDLNQTDHEEVRESKSKRTRIETNKHGMLGIKKLKQAGGSLGTKGIDASTPVTLIVTFPPGFSLPSKNDLIAVFGKFGPLNEKETGVLYNSNCSRVVFMKSCDGEEAFKTCIKKSPFGSDKVKYRLRYFSAGSRAGETNQKANSPHKEGGKTPVNPAGSQPSSAFDEASKFLLMVKQKLEMMSSILEESDGEIMSVEMKSKLKDQMKGLLEEVSTVTKSSSS
ncbi:hypothetical protein U1Q18_012458 [Sarracenia purpurea var. burkii]